MLDQNMDEQTYWNAPISITKERWMELLEDRDMIHEQDLQLLNLIYDSSGYKATAGQLAQLLNLPHFVLINSRIGQMGKRIANQLNLQTILRKGEVEYKWWTVPFIGYGSKDGYYWKLRPELQEAMGELNARGKL